jgi:hypothetical protein
MGIQIEKTPDAAPTTSTGAVPYTGNPATIETPTSNASTGAVAYASPGITRAEHIDAEPVIVAHPTGPVTTTVSWLSEAETKVVEPAPKPTPKKSTVKPETK